MKIAHASLLMGHYPGIARMRESEARAGARLDGHVWTTWVASPHAAYATGAVRHVPVGRPGAGGTTPSDGRLAFFAARALSLNFSRERLAFAGLVNTLTRDNDVVLVRYLPADLLAWGALRRRERIVFVHHSRAVRELVGQSRLGALVERLTGPLQARGTAATCGVTPEIAAAEGRRLLPGAPRLFFPNALDLDGAPAPVDARGGPLKLVMLSSDYRSWQGLDRLLDALEAYPGGEDFELHLAGRMRPELRRRAAAQGRVRLHGELDAAGVLGLLAGADLGLGTFAADRKGLEQTVSIKVRECLAAGVPVAGGCEDPAFPPGFAGYTRLAPGWRWAELLDLARRARGESRARVRDEAAPWISCQAVLTRLARELQSILAGRGASGGGAPSAPGEVS